LSARARVSLVGAGALALALVLFALRPDFLDRIELASLDARFRLRGAVPPRSSVAIVAVDARSVDRLGRWPWRRSVMAELIDRLTEAGVTAIGFDIVYSEPEVTPEGQALAELWEALARTPGVPRAVLTPVERALREAQPDARLAEAIEGSGRVVVGYFFRTEAHAELDGGLDAEPLGDALSVLRGSEVAVARLPAQGRLPLLTCSHVEPNLPVFHAAARRAGFFSADKDLDGVIRRSSLVARCGGRLFVSLPLAMLELLTGERARVEAGPDGLLHEIRVGRRRIPTDPGGKVLVNFRGPSRTFPHLSAVDVLEGRVGEGALRGRPVIVGATEVGIMDIHPTPFGRVFPGVEVHANVLDNLLAGDVLRRSDGMTLTEVAFSVLAGCLLALGLPRLGSALRGAALAAALSGGWIAACALAFAGPGWWLLAVYPGLSVLLVYLATAITHSVTVESQARAIRRAFATYQSPEVVEEIARHPEFLRLGGERRELSILFSDIADFTTLSESIGPENVVRFLNAYLTPMSEIVFESRGTLDKYIGDAVMAFWGAPLELPDHPVRAARAALRMQGATRGMRENPGGVPGMDRLEIRIGIHTDEVAVGNMGSGLRFDYTVVGDGVNLCSRLEGLCKTYGVGILASESLAARLPEGFVLRELDTLRVKGKRRSVRVFELRGERPLEPGEAEFLQGYARALDAWRKGDFERARRGFEALRRGPGAGDRASGLFLERIAALGGEPPPGWDGVWTFETK